MIQIILLLALIYPGIFIKTPLDKEYRGEIETPQINGSFRYVIYGNEMRDFGGVTTRQMEVLLEAEAFSEATLEILFRRILRRFPSPDTLTVDVYTSLKQIKTPEEREIGEITEGPDNPEVRKYNRAVLLRRDGNELFRYTTNPPSREMKTIVLKGKAR
jgi:hypothetical protein